MILRRPEWLDFAVGIAGFCLSVLSALALLSDKQYFSEEIAVSIALSFGLLIVLIAIFFRPKHSLQKIKLNDIEGVTTKLLDVAEEMIIVNPAHLNSLTESLLPAALELDISVSVVSDASLLMNIINLISETEEEKLFNSTIISGVSSNEFIICFIHRGRKKISVIFITSHTSYVFKLNDSVAVDIIASILKRENQELDGFIGLGKVASPRKMISVICDEQKRYLQNFQSLQRGYISFYGTEVQSVQAGWVESETFSTIDTLDLTVRPDRLLKRQRYNAANSEFINKGGHIRRVYMVRASDFENPTFRKDITDLYCMQKNIGVDIGLVFIDELQLHYRKDFIIYDNSIVLVEDQQASSDYTLGRSTAYFGVEDIMLHRGIFNAVWSGQETGRSPQERAMAELDG